MKNVSNYNIAIKSKGNYIIATQHHPEEFNIKILNSQKEIVNALLFKEFKSTHSHDNEVSSAGIEIEGDMDLEKLNKWFSYILREFGNSIFRMKGVISVKNDPNRYVFQGVHMLLGSTQDRAWKTGEKRKSIFIFIGRKLDRNLLTQGFLRCKALPDNR